MFYSDNPEIPKPSNIKFIHWEFDKNNSDDIITAESTIDLKAGKRFNSDTDIQTGFYFRWSCRIYTPKGLFIIAIAEDNYVISDISVLTMIEMRFLIESSHNTFERLFNDKISVEENERFIPLLFVWDDQKVADIFLQLID
jgi:hypothetical protein